MSSWIIYAILSAIFASLVAIFGKIGIKDIDSTLATTVRAVIMSSFLIIVSLTLDKARLLNTISARPFVFIVLSGIAGAMSWLFYFFAIKNGPVSGVVAIDRLSVVFAVILAALFLSEGLTWKSGVGALLVTGGAVLLSLPR